MRAETLDQPQAYAAAGLTAPVAAPDTTPAEPALDQLRVARPTSPGLACQTACEAEGGDWTSSRFGSWGRSRRS